MEDLRDLHDAGLHALLEHAAKRDQRPLAPANQHETLAWRQPVNPPVISHVW
jgi:hypothetical protein